MIKTLTIIAIFLFLNFLDTVQTEDRTSSETNGLLTALQETVQDLRNEIKAQTAVLHQSIEAIKLKFNHDFPADANLTDLQHSCRQILKDPRPFIKNVTQEEDKTVTPESVSAIIIIDQKDPHVQIIRVSLDEPEISTLNSDWPMPRVDPGVLVYNEQIYVIGGWNGTEVDVFDPVENVWSQYEHALTTWRSLPSVAVLNDNVWACGCWSGEDAYCMHQCELRPIDAAQTPSGRWNVIRVPEYVCLEAHAGAVHLGNMYVSGGRCDGLTYKSLYRYQTEDNDWIRLADMKEPRLLHEMASDGRYIYTCGGKHGDLILKSCERYDSEANTWTQIADMPIGRFSLQLVADDDAGRMYAIGGEEYNDRELDNVDIE